MAEWSNAADSKSVIGLVSIWGSNPHLSAIEYKEPKKALFFLLKSITCTDSNSKFKKMHQKSISSNHQN